jgi:hypothetical protein
MTREVAEVLAEAILKEGYMTARNELVRLYMENDYLQGALVPGWTCPACRAFNGDMKGKRTTCRACQGPRPE